MLKVEILTTRIERVGIWPQESESRMLSQPQSPSLHEIDTPKEVRASFSAYCALLALAAANMLCAGDRMIMSVLIQPIKADLGLSDTQMGVISGLAFAIFNGIALIPIGMLADRHSRKKLIAICLFLWSGMTALGSQANSFVHLLLIRIGVGVGEAGSGPIAISMISDLFPPAQRARAISLFFISAPFGTLITAAGGSWIAQHYGWRTALLAAGLPGIALAGLLWLTVRDPRRGAFDKAKSGSALPLTTVVRTIMRQRALLHTMLGIALTSFVISGVGTWAVTFLTRSHGFSLATAGALSAISSLAGMAGAFSGGQVSDRFSNGDIRWCAWTSAAGAGLAVLPLIGFLLFDNAMAAVACLAGYAFFSALYMGPGYSLIQTIIAPRARATANSFTYLLSSAFGFGLGPLAAGALSDHFAWAGSDALRYGLIVVGTALIWSAFHFYRAAKTALDDLAITNADAA
ncbi:spinster family MFS transporter [Sphingomonas sp. KC8]|uniref:spinster family MFS transporter n=1 Tax=Sphingomonas sp. KC8 TaxID=1030157 RepID=UPI000A31D3B7|nr:MFS transporter [Sphingomonas sp. KC8]ARS28729.1 MFS transporter [Sphingomonas sp. KC8]